MSDAPPDKEKPRRSDTTARYHLHGRQLQGARITWGILFVLVLFMLALAIPEKIDEIDDETLLENIITEDQLDISVTSVGAYFAVLYVVSTAVFVGVAVILFRQRPDDWMVMLTSVMLLTFGGIVVNGTTGVLAEAHPSLDPLLNFMGAVGDGAFVLFLYLFPSGRFVPRWTKPVAIAGVIVFAVLNLLPSEPLRERSWLAFAGPFTIYAISAYTGFAPRYRAEKYASREQEQQVKWVAAGLVAALIGFTGYVLPPLIIPALDEPGLAKFIFTLSAHFAVTVALSLVPIAIGLSILRHRLWDVDFYINRSIVYGGLTVLLLVAFVGDFLALHLLLKAILGHEQTGLAVGIAAAVIAGFFNPVRNFMRHLIDRHVYGIELDYGKAIKEYKALGKAIQKKADTATHLGDYANLKLLGRGGMGEVYLGEHPTLNRRVAIKIMPASLALDSDARKRFVREAQVTANLKHPNIVQVFDVGEMDGAPYMVMEYVEGESLSALLEERGRLPLDEALLYLQDIASALDYAHKQGIVHRDIKPSNVMIEPVTSSGDDRTHRAVLMDFGIAKIYAAATKLTGTGMVGTLDYVSPEQIQGAAEVDERADIYSFGVMAYQVLTGELPFKQSHPGAILMAHLMQPPPDPGAVVADLPAAVSQAIQRAMAKKPEERHQTVGEMVAALV